MAEQLTAEVEQGAAQFFGTPAAVPPKPQFACLGKVGEIGEVKAPEGDSKFYSMAVTLEPIQSGIKKALFLRFWPEAFTTDPDSYRPDFNIAKGDNAANDVKRGFYWCYKLSLVSDDGTAQLQGLIGSKWPQFMEDLKAAHAGGRSIDPAQFRAVVTKHAKGNSVLYILRQASQVNEAGDRQYKDDHEISSVMPLTQDNLKSVVKRAVNSQKKEDIRKRLELRFVAQPSA